jgi:hypothetical protein
VTPYPMSGTCSSDRSEQRLGVARHGQLQFFLPILITALFLGLLSTARIATAIKTGADEDYELSKALLYVRGFHFYTQIWNDQPLLHTALVAAILNHISPSVLGPRLLTAIFSVVLLISLFSLSKRFSGLFAAALATVFLIGSPGFVDLSASCMVEIPALSAAVAALAVFMAIRQSKPKIAVGASGVLFGIALQIKLINLILLPLLLLVAWLAKREEINSVTAVKASRIQFQKRFVPEMLRAVFFQTAIFSGAVIASFLIINFLLQDSFLHHLNQTWLAHFARTRSFEYGSPDEYRFDWAILFRNWDQTILAVFGIAVCLNKMRQNAWLILPVAWFSLEIVVFGIHKPWWSYYYIHNAIPTCWCAAIGVVAAFDYLRKCKSAVATAVASVFVLSAATWMSGRVYLQISTIRHSPQTYNSLVLTEIERFKPFTEFMFTDEGVYSFHAGIPLPPKLAVLSLKRFWSGDMTNERLRSELWDAKPGLFLLKSAMEELPYKDLLRTEYSLVYDDQKHRLYARKDIVKLAKW